MIIPMIAMETYGNKNIFSAGNDVRRLREAR
jgi:hypothetical protein